MTDDGAGTTLIVTCSMGRDLALFALLARSVDDCLGPAARHLVIVPARDLPGFARFRTTGREIVAQEDVLPFRAWPLPGAVRSLAPVLPALRRPLYLDARLRPLRGWILQQILKIEAGRRATQAAVMHVDSDVLFFRAMPRAAVFDGDRVRLFRAGARDAAPIHPQWAAAAARLLGHPEAAACGWHYVENCVVWSPQVVRAMTARIEAATGRAWHDALRGEQSFSEYFLYGLFADLVMPDPPLSPGPVTPCRSLWDDAAAGVDTGALLDGVGPLHAAIAVQSTHPLDETGRRTLWQAARMRFGGG